MIQEFEEVRGGIRSLRMCNQEFQEVKGGLMIRCAVRHLSPMPCLLTGTGSSPPSLSVSCCSPQTSTVESRDPVTITEPCTVTSHAVLYCHVTITVTITEPCTVT